MDPGEDFHSFVAARSGALFRGALALTGSREAAEDLVQETLERTFRRWRTIADMDAPDAYVRRIMVNLANNRWKRFRRVVPQQDAGDDRPAPGDEYGRIDIRDQLVRALQRLPIGMRTVVVLRYFHDLSDAEIAEDLRITPSAVRSQLTRGTVTHGSIDNCKPGSVIALSPLSPTVLHGGEKVDLTLPPA